MLNKVKNEAGMNLVGVMIAIGLASGLFLVIGKMMNKSNKVVRTAEVGLEALDFEALVEDTLRNRDACTNTFGQVFDLATGSTQLRAGVVAGNSNLLDTNVFEGKSGIFNANREILWKKDELVIGGLKLKSLKIAIDRMKPDGTIVPNFTEISSSPKIGFLELDIRLEKTLQAKQTFGAKDKALRLFLTAQMYDDSGVDRIHWCQLSGGNLQGSSTPTLVDFYQCPEGTGGWGPGGSWASLGCTGQISTSKTCTNIHYPHVQNRDCTLLGKVHVSP